MRRLKTSIGSSEWTKIEEVPVSAHQSPIGDAVDEIVEPLREVGVAAELEGHGR